MKEPRSRAGASTKAAKATTAGASAAKPASPAKAGTAKRAAPAKAATAAKTTTPTRRPAAAADYRKEIDSLRREVEKLKAQLARIHEQSDAADPALPAAEEVHPWLRIAATVGVTFVLGKMMQLLRVPAAAAVAVPMITAEVNRRIL
ncbi:hypothetical protein SAMN03159496_03542 [Rhizobium sp. NFR07]|uniref:hypothetical protein n=1 Tax=Rhizobium sp. NFR07 TaxID=1566262 RepID=UPI0008E5AF04|nr:hypothetical protein [Rhizobium sp. NFR07]SFB42200.1 hypothetical protein SAMN03159496_03542 [Rhizobium sp. NFR07]